ncbi:ankyrin repeat protein [Rutstroemia sp. NJR-2017a WRK4]|nr:ankyrin repeat protein [Rutstroemia sp. NJR-2017a WRK4]PQE14796.1 ankyrin repeat protein [Rutstroemia sp. NJR-2017a WRK4]
MEPEKQKLGGRPKIPWTASRKRKLIRLYLMTTLDYHQIRALISTDGFNPWNIQAQLSTLLPNVKKNRRIYGPSGIAQGKARLAVWKKCREYTASRHARRKLKSRRELQGLPEKILPRNSTEDVSIPSPTLLRTSPYYDPLVHWNYEAVLPFGIPSHVSMPEIGSWYSNMHMKPSLLGGQAPSTTGKNRDSDKEVHVGLAQVNGIEALPPVLGQSPVDIPRQVSPTRVSEDRTSSPPTRRISTASFRTMKIFPSPPRDNGSAT